MFGCELFWGIFCVGEHFVPWSFCPRWFFDMWLKARWLLSGGFLRRAFDRIPIASQDMCRRLRKLDDDEIKLRLRILPDQVKIAP